MKKTNTIRVFFGLRIKELRLRSGLSQEAFADKCGLDRTYISGIERGIRNPTLEVICILADSLNVELSTLFQSNPGHRE